MPTNDNKQNTAYYQRRLPHWQPAGATFFVTMRLAGSIPMPVIRELQARQKEERKQIDSQYAEHSDEHLLMLAKLYRKNFEEYDAILDNLNEPYHLRIPAIRDLVADSIRHREGTLLETYAFCLMPNHLHWVFRHLATAPVLWRVLQDFKKYTGLHCNRILGQEGQFWQTESYDHIVRDERELGYCINYTLQNPVKARLVKQWEDWPGTVLRIADP